MNPIVTPILIITQQMLEETGEDVAKYDSFAPTVVRPKIRERPGAINAGDVSWSDIAFIFEVSSMWN